MIGRYRGLMLPGILLTLPLLVSGSTMAEERGSPFEVEVTADVFSKYVWRGQNVTDGWVFQPGVSGSCYGATLGYWGNLDLTDDNGESGEFIEHDWYVDYYRQLTERIGVSVGAIYYVFPSAGETTELYWGLNFDVPAGPAITVYHDVDAIDGTYASLSVGHSVDPPENLPFGIDLGASLGWGSGGYNRGYWGTTGGELNDLTLTAGFPFGVAGISVTPSVTYVALVGGDIRDAGADDSLFIAGIGFAKGF
jgi:uncharacterized protein (TIGR02001 family)